MAKYRASKSRAKKKSSKGAIPCVILILSGFALLFLLFYYVFKSSV